MPEDALAAAVRSLNLDLDDAALDRLRYYRDLIAAGATRFSLTSVRDPEAIERRHLVESLAFGAALDQRGLLENGARLLDVGSGAGLPGIPLKIAWPELRVILLEATAKKCVFLRETIDALGLEDIDVLERRAEEAAHDAAHRATYDLVVARAVAPLPVLLEYALPFLRSGGVFAATKGSGTAQELADAVAALRELGGRLIEATPFEPPDGQSQTLILVAKDGETPDRYPRRTGIPTKRPLR